MNNHHHHHHHHHNNNNNHNPEVATRNRILEIYNKRPEDFGSLREYNDYLEEVEDIIFALVEGHDVEAIEARVAKYKDENYDQIVMSQARKAEERVAQLRDQSAQAGGAAAAGAVGGDTKTDVLIETVQNGQDGAGIKGAGAMQYMPSAPGMMQQPRAMMMMQPVPVGGGDGSHSHSHLQTRPEDEETIKEREIRGIRAGGFTSEFGRKRALEEAFASLFMTRVHH